MQAEHDMVTTISQAADAYSLCTRPSLPHASIYLRPST